MKRSVLEWALYLSAIAVLSGLVGVEGAKAAQLQGRVPVAPKELYKSLTRSGAKVQVVDARASVSDDYEDSHVPGAIPFPNCELDAVPPKARGHLLSYVPTVVVSAEGDPALFERCAAHFTLARNLEGGLAAWLEAGLPEDSGEYAPPRPGAGGGCL